MTTLPTRPTKDALWGDTSSNIVEPTTGKKHAGWSNAEDPPSGTFNWWQNLTYQWQAWSRDAVDALNTGKLDVTIAASTPTTLGNTTSGNLDIGTLTHPIGNIVANALVTPGVDITTGGLLQLSTGALITGGLVPRESASTLGILSAPWDAFLGDTTVGHFLGHPVFSSDPELATLSISGTSHDSLNSAKRRIAEQNTITAWATIAKLANVAFTGGAQVLRNHNFNGTIGLATVGGNKVIRFSFFNAMANASYAVLPSLYDPAGVGPGGVRAYTVIKTTTSFDITLYGWDDTGKTWVTLDPSATSTFAATGFALDVGIIGETA